MPVSATPQKYEAYLLVATLLAPSSSLKPINSIQPEVKKLNSARTAFRPLRLN
jgi:hypothetical protein